MTKVPPNNSMQRTALLRRQLMLSVRWLRCFHHFANVISVNKRVGSILGKSDRI